MHACMNMDDDTVTAQRKSVCVCVRVIAKGASEPSAMHAFVNLQLALSYSGNISDGDRSKLARTCVREDGRPNSDAMHVLHVLT